ncbi:SapC family protein [Steroidobacter agaridevorans]|uniref:SapC family protein n=2 Tax=Steroidobacter agaridevorans TaxID=2695856 RepID=A0A829Y9X4_9GAMM|nr:SapC family protein [Steroidobacter agaridevorans]
MREPISMTNHQLLNPQDHGQLRLLPRAGVEPHFVQIVPSEFVAAAIACPILFSKDPATGAFYAGAVLGLKPEEGALKSIEERGCFEPLSLQRDGFFISGERIAIDRANPRFSETEGELLFDDAQPSTSLRRMQRVLGQLHEGIEQTAVLVRDFMNLKLLESIDVSLSFDDGERLTLQGLYTVSRDSLRELEDVDVLRLFRSGHLQLAYTIAGSINQLATLAHVRNRKLAMS